MCYGRNLATDGWSSAARPWASSRRQSIRAEPGTQLTMAHPLPHRRHRHARQRAVHCRTSKSDGFARYIGIQTVKSKTGEIIAMNRNGIMAVVDDKGREKSATRWYTAPESWPKSALLVKANQILLEWDPYTFSILTKSPARCIQRPGRWRLRPCAGARGRSPAVAARGGGSSPYAEAAAAASSVHAVPEGAGDRVRKPRSPHADGMPT